MNHPRCLVALAVFVPLAACDALVDADHRGEPLARINLAVQNSRTQSTAGAEVVVVWQNNEGSPDIVSAESATVEGNFPTQFQLSIYEPPADELQFGAEEEVQLGAAFIFATAIGTDYSDPEKLKAGLIGVEKSHVLIWTSDQVPAGSDAAAFLRSTPSAGFHIFGVRRHDDAERERRLACVAGLPAGSPSSAMYTVCGGSPFHDDLVPTTADLETELTIELADEVVGEDVPNWD